MSALDDYRAQKKVVTSLQTFKTATNDRSWELTSSDFVLRTFQKQEIRPSMDEARVYINQAVIAMAPDLLDDAIDLAEIALATLEAAAKAEYLALFGEEFLKDT